MCSKAQIIIIFFKDVNLFPHFGSVLSTLTIISPYFPETNILVEAAKKWPRMFLPGGLYLRKAEFWPSSALTVHSEHSSFQICMKRTPKRCHYGTDWPWKCATAILLTRANNLNVNAVIYACVTCLLITSSLWQNIVCSVRISQHARPVMEGHYAVLMEILKSLAPLKEMSCVCCCALPVQSAIRRSRWKWAVVDKTSWTESLESLRVGKFPIP